MPAPDSKGNGAGPGAWNAAFGPPAKAEAWDVGRCNNESGWVAAADAEIPSSPPSRIGVHRAGFEVACVMSDRSPMTTLETIVAHKREEVARAKEHTSVDQWRERIGEIGRPRNFFASVTKHATRVETAIIAEIKRKSPSAGWIRAEYEDEGFDPAVIARTYHEAGASAISCLTDERFFGGKIEYLFRVKDASPLPVLRKDFIVDPWQIWESRACGADAILLIAECLSQSELVDFSILARELQLTTLIECHDMENLLRALPHVGFPDRSYGLLGINNRDLRTMRVDLNHTMRLAMMVEDTQVLVSESGIKGPQDLRRLREVGVRIVLVGESLMREADPGAALRALRAID